MPKITKKELFKMAAAAAGWPAVPPVPSAWSDGARHAARALGYEVVEEPELPERLRFRPGMICAEAEPGDEMVAVSEGAAYLAVPHQLSPEEPTDPRTRRILDSSQRLATEVVLRYNAKTEVLKIADELNKPFSPLADAPREVATRLRAAYED